MAYNGIGMGVTLLGLDHPEFGYTVYLASGTGKAHVGCALSADTTANTMKPAADGDIVRGVLFTFEDRSQEGILVGAMQTKGGYKLPVKSGATINVGQSVVGAGDGTVKAATTAQPNNFVAEVLTGYVVVVFQ